MQHYYHPPLVLGLVAVGYSLQQLAHHQQCYMTLPTFYILFFSIKVVHVTGALRPEMSLSQYNHHPPSVLGFVAVAYSLPPPTISEIRLDPNMFMCKVDLDLTITFCETK